MNVGIFFQCIEAVHNVSPEGFAAIKVTALGLPAILERFSKAILETQQLFSQLDKDGTGEWVEKNWEREELLNF
jgi:proline dehydrogenase